MIAGSDPRRRAARQPPPDAGGPAGRAASYYNTSNEVRRSNAAAGARRRRGVPLPGQKGQSVTVTVTVQLSEVFNLKLARRPGPAASGTEARERRGVLSCTAEDCPAVPRGRSEARMPACQAVSPSRARPGPRGDSCQTSSMPCPAAHWHRDSGVQRLACPAYAPARRPRPGQSHGQAQPTRVITVTVLPGP
jgi:hypothetical protein